MNAKQYSKSIEKGVRQSYRQLEVLYGEAEKMSNGKADTRARFMTDLGMKFPKKKETIDSAFNGLPGYCIPSYGYLVETLYGGSIIGSDDSSSEASTIMKGCISRKSRETYSKNLDSIMAAAGETNNKDVVMQFLAPFQIRPGQELDIYKGFVSECFGMKAEMNGFALDIKREYSKGKTKRDRITEWCQISCGGILLSGIVSSCSGLIFAGNSYCGLSLLGLLLYVGVSAIGEFEPMSILFDNLFASGTVSHKTRSQKNNLKKLYSAKKELYLDQLLKSNGGNTQ